MLHNTRGIVLHHIRYSETSLIIRIYTKNFGLQSYLVKGARSRRSKMPGSMFRPMTLLEMVVDHREKRDLQNIREASIQAPFHSIATDIRKSTVAIFLAEVLLKTIREHEENLELFDFLASSLQYFDMQEKGIENFHLYLLLMLSKFIGLFPQGEASGKASFFDLREGKFKYARPWHPDFLDGESCHSLYMLAQRKAPDLENLKLDKAIRSKLLDALLIYYQIHLSGLGHVRSIDVLREVFA